MGVDHKILSIPAVFLPLLLVTLFTAKLKAILAAGKLRRYKAKSLGGDSTSIDALEWEAQSDGKPTYIAYVAA